MQKATSTRIALFVVVAATLVATAILFSRGSGWTGVEEEATGARGADRYAAQLERIEADAEADARRFLATFFRYEVGDLTPGVRRALRATTTPKFGRQLLAFPPRRPPANRFPPRAVLRQINVTFASSQAALALVDGTAMRAGFPEEFGFAFTRTASGWLASGPAE